MDASLNNNGPISGPSFCGLVEAARIEPDRFSGRAPTLLTMFRSSRSPLKLHIRAELFRQLGAMEEAGLPIDKALSLTRLPLAARRRLVIMRGWLKHGSAVAEAGLRSGLFTPLEASLL